MAKTTNLYFVTPAAICLATLTFLNVISDAQFKIVILTVCFLQCSESSDDGSSFTNDDAREVYQAWLKEKSKHDIKVMAVMFMDNLIERFDMTTLGAAKEVGLLLGHNEKTIRTWRRDFYNNGGLFTESLQGKHSRQFVLDDEELRH